MSLTDFPELRPIRIEHDGVPFPGTEIPAIPTALKQIDTWIEQGQQTPQTPDQPAWISWPDEPERESYYGPVSLNTGAAGIAWYSLYAADVLGQQEHSDRADRALTYVTQAWRTHVDLKPIPFSGIEVAYYGGLSGIGVVLAEAAASNPDRWRTATQEVFAEVIARADRDSGRWIPTGTFLGDGGVITSLLQAGDRIGDDELIEAALRAGHSLLRQNGDEDPGSRWPGVTLRSFGFDSDVELDGFETGRAGIAYVFARLANISSDRDFVLAARSLADGVLDKFEYVRDAALLPNAYGNYSFGYCTGASGTIRSLIQVYRTTNDHKYLDGAIRLARGILRSGVPGRQTPGHQNLHSQCCGSAAIIESFVGLWLVTADPLWLEAANLQTDELLTHSVSDNRGRRWYSPAVSLPVGATKAEVGYQVGAAGIGVSLLRVLSANQAASGTAEFQTRQLPDDPYPNQPQSLPQT